jgi:hypothetical protein
LAGAIVGGVLGLLLGRVKVCRSEQCRARPHLAASVIAGAVFGAGVAFHFAR